MFRSIQKSKMGVNTSTATLCVMILFSCQSEQKSQTETSSVVKESPTTVTIESTNFESASGTFESLLNESGETYVLISGEDAWLAYNVEIPAAGRFRFEVKACADQEASVWMEDYIDNKDDRTYNVTGKTMLQVGKEFGRSTKDGSPLNRGTHRMKLHIEGDSVKIKSFSFTLMREHSQTPIRLVQNMAGDEWEIAWSDEFNGSGIPDTSKWTFDIGNWGWGNNELQYYTEMREENARMEDGNLIIEARKDDMGQAWTSTRLTTRGKETFLYGRIEFRAKVPSNKGNWAAGWTLGDEYIDEISWPYCGEIDILESVGYEMNDTTGNGIAHASAHCGAYYFKLGNQPTGIVDVKNMENEFHIYAVDWTPENIIAYVDGEEYFTYDDTSSELSWPFDQYQNIILNLTMGGGWGGQRGMDSSVTSQKMYIDYVRVYQKK